MKGCEYYEVEISALLDGESDPARAVEILDHVTRCPSCRQFYQEVLKGRPVSIGSVEIGVSGLDDGTYRAQVFDVDAGTMAREHQLTCRGGSLRIALPALRRDWAVKVRKPGAGR